MLTKVLEINLVSDDNTVESVKESDKELTMYDDSTHTYTEFIKNGTQELTFAIKAKSSYAKVKYGDDESLGSLSIGNVNVANNDETTLKFKVISEYGTEQEYTIKIYKMSNNADAESIKVDGIEILDQFENVDSVPTYVYSIAKEKSNAQIEVVGQNKYAKIQIGDETSETSSVLKNIALDVNQGSITVPIVITSQDETVVKTYNIMFVRLPNNTNITSVYIGKDSARRLIIPNSDGDYEVTVKASDVGEDIAIILSDVLANVSLGGIVETGRLEAYLVLPETGKLEKTITVTAQDGTIAKHKLIISKQENNLGLNKVYLNNRIATKVDDNTFSIDVKKGTSIADIKAIAEKDSEYVSIENSQMSRSENTYNDCDISAKKVKITVTAMFVTGESSEIDEQKEYTLIIKEKDDSKILDDLKVTIKADDEIIYPDTDGKYVKVISDLTDNVALSAYINSETSTVKIKDSVGETEFLNPLAQKNINIDSERTEVTVTVKNGNEDIINYDVYLIKETDDIDDNTLKTLIADDEVIEPEEDGTYTVKVAEDATSVNIKAIANYVYSKVSIDGNNATRYENTQDINIENIDFKTIKVAITSINGKTKEYIVNIERAQNELGLKAVYLNNRIATKIDNSTYEIQVTKGTNIVNLKAITANQTSFVQIANNTESLGVNTYENYYLSQGTNVSINVYNSDKSENKTYTLVIKESTVTLDDLLVNIKVDGNVIRPDSDGNYTCIVDSTKYKSNIWAGTNSNTSMVNIIDKSNNEETGFEVVSSTKDIILSNTVNEISVIVKSGDGTEKTYTVYIVKDGEDADNANLKSLVANGTEIIPDSDGVYSIEIDKNTNNVELVATTELITSKVSIAGNTETRNVNTYDVNMGFEDSKELVIIVKSIGGTIKYYNVRIHREHEDLELSSILVDGRRAYKTGDTEYEIDIVNSKNTCNIEAIANVATDYVQIDSNVARVGRDIYNNYVVTNDKTIVSIIVSNEEGASKEYKLTIKKTKEELKDLVPVIKVDGNTILPDTDGVYIAVVASTKESAELWAGIDSSSSKIKIGENEYKQISDSETVILDSNEVEKYVFVKNGEGTEKEYKVIIIKSTDSIYDVNLKELKAGNGATKEGTVDLENNGTYSVYIKKGATSVDLTAIANYEYAKVSIDGNDYRRGSDFKTVTVGNADEKRIMVTVESVSGRSKDYIVNIYRAPDELELKQVLLDNRKATKVSDTEYEIDTVNTIVNIKAELFNKTTEMVAIYDGDLEIGETTYNNYDISISKTVNIKVTNGLDSSDSNYKEQNYKLTITKVDKNEDLSDLQLTVKVGENIIQKSDDGIYKAKVSLDSEKAVVSISSTSDTSKVKIADFDYEPIQTTKNVELNDEITKVKLYIVNGNGDELVEELWIIKTFKITGKIITQATDLSNQSALITLYNTDDTRAENDIDDPRAIVEQVNINPDGTFEIDVRVGKYDIVVTKLSYLEYRLVGFEAEKGIEGNIGDIQIYAGDIVTSGEIEIDDLTYLNDNIGVVINDDNKDDELKFDLNEDGIIDGADRAILKANYSKVNEIVKWVNPNDPVTTSMYVVDESKSVSENGVALSNSNFILPMTCDYTISSKYGYRTHPVSGEQKLHSGLDIVGTWHTEILAVANGEVTYAGVQNGYGNCIEIKHIVNGEAIYSFYAHLSQINVQVGDKVSQGDIIALEGGAKSDPNHGTSTGHHLHFEIRSQTGSGHSVDPNNYIKF